MKATGDGRLVPMTNDEGTVSAGRWMRTSVALRGPWSFRRVPGTGADANANALRAGVDEWMPATVPGCVHLDLL